MSQNPAVLNCADCPDARSAAGAGPPPLGEEIPPGSLQAFNRDIPVRADKLSAPEADLLLFRQLTRPGNDALDRKSVV